LITAGDARGGRALRPRIGTLSVRAAMIVIRRIARTLVVLAALIVVTQWAGPMLEPMRRAARIVLQSAPNALPVPVAGVSARALRDSWGAPRSDGRRHQGVDIFAPRGTPVRSTTAGIVWSIGQNRLGGNVVWVLGPGSQLHYYAHLDRFAAIRRGEVVAPGTTLGYVGNTGNARGGPHHLHYGIYAPARGGAINPFPLLATARRKTIIAARAAAQEEGRASARPRTLEGRASARP